MAIIKFEHKGDFKKTSRFLNKVRTLQIKNILDKYGKLGVKELKEATPRRTGKTADSWYYEIKMNEKGYGIYWNNSNTNNGIPIAVLIQFGHGTRNGGYVPPTDYINPAMKPIFDKLAEQVWREVTSL